MKSWILFSVALALLIATTAHAERGYYSAPRGGADHRAGAFYGNGPVISAPSMHYRSHRRPAGAYGYFEAPRRTDRYPYDAHGRDEYPTYNRRDYDDRAYGPRAGATIEYGDGVIEQPYNPRYHGHDSRRRELERRSQYNRDSGWPPHGQSHRNDFAQGRPRQQIPSPNGAGEK